GPPGSMSFAGPAGISNSSSQLLFMYPKYIVNEPSAFGIQPSYAGDTVCPDEYVNRVCARSTANEQATAAAANATRIARLKPSRSILQTSDFRLQISDFRLQTSYFSGVAGGAQHNGQPMS